MPFDNLEYISIENQTTDFPKHFHETFCISLIHKGVEQIDFEHQSLFSEEGSISITNPYEIHSNPLLNNDASLKFDTVYLSNDLMKYLLKGTNITFLNKKINNTKTNRLFIELINAIDSKNIKLIEFSLSQLANALQYYSKIEEHKNHEQDFSHFKEINGYIEDNIHNKFCLNELSKMANINKFGFVKKFKSSVGMTPMNYILMKKIFSCKELIKPNSELTQIAYLYSFTDMAHFSKTFKKYIGLSPKTYQKKLIKL